MAQQAPPWAPHPDSALESRLASGDTSRLLGVLVDPALQADSYARLRAFDGLRATGSSDPRLLQAWLQAMLLGNRPIRAWQVTSAWPVDASTPADAQLLAAQIARAVGRSDEARARFQSVLGRHPHWVDALQKYVEFEHGDRVPTAVIQALERIHSRGSTDYDREKAGFALSRVFASSNPLRAFELAASSQAMKRARTGPWNEARLAGRLASDRCRVPHASSGQRAREIFIVGLPRSGTTLLASMLGAHPSIANVGEQGLLPALGAGALPAATESTAGCRNWYRAAVADLADGAPVVVDKLPANAEYAGLALARFPDALVIHLERALEDCATSIHMHDFESGHEYAADGADIGRYARLIGAHLEHVYRQADGRVVPLRFEHLVRSPEACLRPLLERLGLDWTPSIPDFWRKDVQTATYSEAQVREPVHTRSIGSAARFLPAARDFLEAVGRGAGVEWHHPQSAGADPVDHDPAR